MIKRFEDEYPETRLPSRSPPPLNPLHASPSETSILSRSADADNEPDHDDEEGLIARPMLSRHNSDVSLASKALAQEEGRMHRFGQKFRRDIIAVGPDGASAEGAGQGAEGQHWEPHLEVLRGMIEEMGGEEMKRKIEEGGQEAVLRELRTDASTLRETIIRDDPEGWERFRSAQEAAMLNASVDYEGVGM